MGFQVLLFVVVFFAWIIGIYGKVMYGILGTNIFPLILSDLLLKYVNMVFDFACSFYICVYIDRDFFGFLRMDFIATDDENPLYNYLRRVDSSGFSTLLRIWQGR